MGPIIAMLLSIPGKRNRRDAVEALEPIIPDIWNEVIYLGLFIMKRWEQNYIVSNRVWVRYSNSRCLRTYD